MPSELLLLHMLLLLLLLLLLVMHGRVLTISCATPLLQTSPSVSWPTDLLLSVGPCHDTDCVPITRSPCGRGTATSHRRTSGHAPHDRGARAACW